MFLEILVLKIFWIKRLFWEIFVLIGSLVVLYVGLHSYLCFSHLEKLFWKAGSTPPRYLAICQASQAFFLNAISTPPRHLVDWSSFCSWIWFFVARYLLDTSVVKHYWRVYIFFHCDSSLISSISLNLSTTVHLPNTLIFTPNLFLEDSSSFFKFLFT